MIHYNTKNLSAIKFVYILEEMGIKNNKFILQLNNPELLDIDPFDDNLTNIQKAMVTKEIIENPWYYFREIIRIPAAGGLVSFEFHRGNVGLIWAILNDISVFVVWPRQCYKTTTMQAIYSYMFYWGSTHNNMCFIALEDSIVKKNLQGVKDIRDNLPPYLNLYNTKADRDNEKMMVNSSNDNSIVCRAPARNPDGARKAGRGLTLPILWFDEISFIKYIYDMYDSVSFAYSKASESAKENGAPHHQAMTTTAGFLNTEEGRWAHNFLLSCADFTEMFYDMEIETVKAVIDNSSSSGFLNLSFMYYDLGKDENYLEEQKRRLINSPTPKDTLDREVLNMWKSVSTEHPLGQERIEKLADLIQKPKDYIIINDTYSMRIYVDINEFDWSKPLIGGGDLGGSLKGDFSVITLVDPTDFSVVGVMRSNSQSTVLFAMAILTIMVELAPNMIFFPERNFNSAIIDTVVNLLPDSRARVYHEDPIRAGLFNSKKVRPILFNNILRLAVDEYGNGIRDKNIITEIEGLIRTKSGRVDHRPGSHDDTLVSYLLALYFLLYVEDKGKYIDTGLILSAVEKSGLIGNKQNKKKISNKLNRMVGNSYLKLVTTDRAVQSLDDIADIMINYSQSSNTPIDTRVEVYSGEDSMDEIEESDNLSEVRTKLDKLKTESSAKVSKVYNDAQKNTGEGDFKDVFKSYFGW